MQHRSLTFLWLAVLIAVTSIIANNSPSISAQSGPAPGGFVELASNTVARTPPTASQMASFVPSSRGRFFFPAPYNTEGYRLTIPSDCGGGDCVQQAGYSDWPNINYNAGSNTLRALVSLYGMGGATLFTLDKTTGAVTNNGAILSPGDPLYGSRAEGWYWSESNPDWLYAYSLGGSVVQRINVVTRTQTTVANTAARTDLWGTNARFYQAHSSSDDQVHSLRLIDGSTGSNRGCAVYFQATNTYRFWPVTLPMQCYIDKSGRYLLIYYQEPGRGTDLRYIDVNTLQEFTLLDQNGSPGHHDRGYGYMLGLDNWNARPGAWRLWNLSQPWDAPGNGRLIYYDAAWDISYGQPTMRNAVPESVRPITQQYACGTGTAEQSPNPPTAREREIYCVMLDGSFRTLIVAPNLTVMEASGGGTAYFKAPKGNVDTTGQYYFWAANMGTNRLDAFIVRIPHQVLTGGGSGDTTPPTASVTSPAGGATVSGTVTVSASASDNVGVTGVQFRLDGNNLGSEDTTSPYSVSWNTTAVANGSHTLTAVARDAAGNVTTSAAVTVTVSNTTPDTTPPTVSLTAPAAGATVSGSTTVSATASDNVGVAGVQFVLDGANLGSEDTTSPYSVVWNTAGVANGTHTLTARARDAAGNTTTSAARTVTVDNSTAQPGPIAAYSFSENGGTTTADSSPTGNNATLSGSTWAVGQFGSSLATNGVGLADAPDQDVLTPGVTATMSAWVYLTSTPTEFASILGKWSQSSEDEYLFGLLPSRELFMAWQTTAGTGYGTPGFNEVTVSGQQVPLNTWTHLAVVRNGTSLSFYIGGTLVSSVDVMDTLPFRNGSNSLRIGGQQRGGVNRFFPGRIDELRIYRRALTASEIAADMNSPIVPAADTTAPSATVTAPSAGATVSGTVSITADASDNVGVAGVQFRVNGANVGAEDTTAAYATSWNTTTVANGSYTLTAVARDAAGNVGTSPAVTVTVANPVADTTPPTASIAAPANGSTVSGTITIQANASDNIGVAGVQFRLDSTNLGAEDTTAPYSVNWITTTATNGSHTLTAIARDAAGNTTTSATVTVVVNNTSPVAGLIASYSFNEGNGSTAADASPFGNTATLTGAAAWGPGRSGTALAVNGAGYANAPDIPGLTPGTTATFEAWVLLTQTPTDFGSIFNKWSQSTNDEYLLGLDPQRRPLFAWRTAAATNQYGTPSFNETRATAAVPLNTWTHVAVVRNGTVLSFYINGELVTQVSAMDNNPFRDGNNSLRIGGQGRSGMNRFFPGRIDEARIYNRALTQAEIQAHVTGGSF